MHIPVTDAFDDTDPMESLEVKLTPDQIQWLRTTAEERDLSVDHVLRTILNTQMREETETPLPPSGSGDSIPHSPNGQPTPSEATSSNEGADDESPRDNESPREDESPSIVESLRSASERLQDLTEEDDDAKGSDLSDTLARLQARTDSDAEEDTQTTGSETVLTNDSPNRSMFDMMED